MTDVSVFYKACRNGNVTVVQELLPSLSLEEINRLEPNGSTALHAAAYYGHKEIVELLLAKGARRQQLNKHKLSPADEASTPEIKKLFHRPVGEKNHRFTADSLHLEWTRSSYDVREISLVNIMYSKPFRNLDEALNIICSAPELRDAKGMEEVRVFLKEACYNDDPVALIRAYTAETDFYRRVNHLLAQMPFRKYTTEDRNRWYVQYAATIDSDEQYAKFGWKGLTYRGMMVTETDLDEYKVGDWIVNKAFLSTSKDRKRAEKFIRQPKPNKLPLITIYNITRDRFGLDISSISEFKHEQEVLVFPNAVFKVVTINRNISPIEIELSDE